MSKSNNSIYDLTQDAYRSFMHKHLQYYGYYTEKNSYHRQVRSNDVKQWLPTKEEDMQRNEQKKMFSESESSDDEEEDCDRLQSFNSSLSSSSKQAMANSNPSNTRKRYNIENGQPTGLLSADEARQLLARYQPARPLPFGTVGPKQVPQWPIELEVLAEQRVTHSDCFVQNEPFHSKDDAKVTNAAQNDGSGVSGNNANSNMKTSSNNNNNNGNNGATANANSCAGNARTVYNYEPPSPEFFIRSRAGGSMNGASMHASYMPSGPDDSTLVFESRFESGNLARAVQLSDTDYELWMRPDLYTRRHTQWYYFRVSNTRANKTYKFTIVNFYKPDSLYNHGMKPLFYSEIDTKKNQTGWRRYGDNIRYYQNDLANITIPRSAGGNELMVASDQQCYYSLTFTFEFPHNNDTCYFAHCYPYTYSDLQDHVNSIYCDSEKSKFCKMRLLCKTVAENVVYLLTITDPQLGDPMLNARLKPQSQSQSHVSSASNASASTETHSSSNNSNNNSNGHTGNNNNNNSAAQSAVKRPVVVVTARVHPGESNASWMMKGMIDFLVSDHPDAKLLRSRFVFKLVPMLNPDGVIVGNYRCGLAGRDLNRQYKSNLKEAYPSVWHTKRMVKKLMEEGYEIALYCDLHGHSRKHNVFIYGCAADQSQSKRFLPQVFPFMLSQLAPEYFDFESCKFRVQKCKMGTGRVAMWQMGIPNSFTMEASFCGSSKGGRAGLHYTTKDFEKVASAYFLRALIEFSDPDKTRALRIMTDLEERAKRSLWDRIEQRADDQLMNQLRYVDLSLPQLEKVASRLAVITDDQVSDDDSDDSGEDESDTDTLPAYVRAALRKQNRRKKMMKKGREVPPAKPSTAPSTACPQINKPNQIVRPKDDNADERRRMKQNLANLEAHKSIPTIQKSKTTKQQNTK